MEVPTNHPITTTITRETTSFGGQFWDKARWLITLIVITSFLCVGIIDMAACRSQPATNISESIVNNEITD